MLIGAGKFFKMIEVLGIYIRIHSYYIRSHLLTQDKIDRYRVKQEVRNRYNSKILNIIYTCRYGASGSPPKIPGDSVVVFEV